MYQSLKEARTAAQEKVAARKARDHDSRRNIFPNIPRDDMKQFVHLICVSTTGLEIDLIAAERERTTQKTEKDEKLHRGCERRSDRSGS